MKPLLASIEEGLSFSRRHKAFRVTDPKVLIERLNPDIAIGHWAMVALEHERATRCFLPADPARRLRRQFEVLMDDLIVENDLH